MRKTVCAEARMRAKTRTEGRVRGTGRPQGSDVWAAWLAEVGPPIEAALDEVLPAESEKPRSVHRAMRYSVFSGGKRMQPRAVSAALTARICSDRAIYLSIPATAPSHWHTGPV